MDDVDVADVTDFGALAGEEPGAPRGPSVRAATGPGAERSSFGATSRGQSCPPNLLLRPAQR
eukprot:2270828-Alexandrium_andersonii.AAC.1